MKLSEYSTLTFDCYGTLIDWETGIYNALQPLLQKLDSSPTRDESLKIFSDLESGIQSEFPDLVYSQILRKVHIAIAKHFDIAAADELHATFGESVRHWPAFPDSAASLQYLKQHYRLVILSNVDRTGFSQSNRHLKVEFDDIFTAQDIGTYKPSINNFNYMLSKLDESGVKKSEILHTAQSLFHDMAPATELGLATCWIDRRAGQKGSGATPVPSQPVKIDFRFESLAEMVTVHQLSSKIADDANPRK